MYQLDRDWTNFQVEAEVDTFGVGRLVAEHNRVRKLAANGSGLHAEECLLRVRRFIRDELKRIEPAFDSVEFGNIKGFADLVDQLIVEILG